MVGPPPRCTNARLVGMVVAQHGGSRASSAWWLAGQLGMVEARRYAAGRHHAVGRNRGLPTARQGGRSVCRSARRVGCEFSQGSWILDGSQPMYNVSICSFIEKQFDCIGNGRPDNLFLKYRWKPSGCELPKFDGQDFLRRFKGKKIMFVGDSLSLNQWQSLTCMLHAAVPKSRFTSIKIGNLSTFSIPDYNISLMLSRNAFLVDFVVEKNLRILKLDSIQNGNSWKGFDMLIFNTWHWWLHKGNQKPWDYIQQGGKLVKDMDRLTAFSEGLKTWSKWVDSNVNPLQTKVFFQGISPTHYNGSEWNAPKGTNCRGETQPINGSVYPGGTLSAVAVVKAVLSGMKTPVGLLDVTTLSALRKDGHPSIYGLDGQKGNDCSHWCLGGVPDTWNQLLYGMLITNGKSKM
ncbi:Protein trichome birefringence-like 37 [Striga hermonthica]|uniref:Protein trichome birefringence-like 37 n=1 Tax=Striga hermonthica TaxID=68872 RepID=A0A9N7MWG7_STRHE|nr:Protein trichome birefringence-like 37 [Striga hermonthica]